MTEKADLKEYYHLQEKARAIYVSPDLVWGRPQFPDPPSAYLEPAEFVDRLADAVFHSNEQFHHPFVARLMRGDLSSTELRAWVKADFPFLVEVLRSDAFIVANGRDLHEIRRQMHVLIEEAGEDLAGGEFPSHPQLWIRFGEALGLTEGEITGAPVHPIMELYLDGLRLRHLQTKIGEMPGNSRFSERTRSIVYPLWQEALEKHYALPSKALAFFEVHGAADWGHGNIGKEVLLPRCRTREEQVRLWTTEGKRLARAWIRMDIWEDAARTASQGEAGRELRGS